MTAALVLDAETASDALGAVKEALSFITAALSGDTEVKPAEARSAAARLRRAAEAMTELADAAEVPLPANVIDFAQAYRQRRDRLRADGAP
jgi:hypothetical protein